MVVSLLVYTVMLSESALSCTVLPPHEEVYLFEVLMTV